MKEFNNPLPINQLLITGASTRETIYRLEDNVSHQEDTVLTARESENTLGGAGICNVIAFARTGVSDNLSFYTVVGGINTIPDNDALFIVKNLADRNISTELQIHTGNTEKTVIYLSGSNGDKKRGFRHAQNDGSVLRNNLEINSHLISALEDNKIVVASSFQAEKVSEMARIHKNIHGEDSTFIWTINEESARTVANNSSVQNTLNMGGIDIICMSEKEREIIDNSGENTQFLDGVSIEVITQGKDGCKIVDRSCGKIETYNIPAFCSSDKTVNDNGAGEAHHANFLATYLACQEIFKLHPNSPSREKVLLTAGHIANLAGFLKVQENDSLNFPSLDYNQIISDIMFSEYSPEEIAQQAYRKHEDKKFHQQLR
jgi:sugar/nucleoside kinase (ribokinase family)